jgi:hypothetical protein
MRRIVQRVRRSLPLGLTAAELTDALLPALLGPGVESTDRESLLQTLLNENDALPGALAGLLRDPRCARQHGLPLLGRLISDDRSTLHLSLGTHCFGAGLLRRWGLRAWSGPFDWLFSSVPLVTHCLEDDFATFLDRRHYEPVPPEARRDGPEANRVHHRLYREMFGVDFIFNHHDVHEAGPYAHFQRAVARLRQALSSEQPKSFLVTRAQGEGPLDDVLALHAWLTRHSANFSLWVYEVPPRTRAPGLCPILEPRLEEPGLGVYTYLPISDWSPLHFDDPLDEHVLVRHYLQAGLAKQKPPSTGPKQGLRT